MAIMLDKLKVYDLVEWSYLENIMRRLGFTEIWIRKVIKCVTSITYSIMVNGRPEHKVNPFKGLRQETPFHPTSTYYVLKDLVPF